jgi:hypothetical protein
VAGINALSEISTERRQKMKGRIVMLKSYGDAARVELEGSQGGLAQLSFEDAPGRPAQFALLIMAVQQGLEVLLATHPEPSPTGDNNIIDEVILDII